MIIAILVLLFINTLLTWFIAAEIVWHRRYDRCRHDEKGKR